MPEPSPLVQEARTENKPPRYQVTAFEDGTPLMGDKVPELRTVTDFLRYFATVLHRFGDTAVTGNLSWGGSALNRSSREVAEAVAKREAEIADDLFKVLGVGPHSQYQALYEYIQKLRRGKP